MLLSLIVQIYLHIKCVMGFYSRCKICFFSFFFLDVRDVFSFISYNLFDSFLPDLSVHNLQPPSGLWSVTNPAPANSSDVSDTLGIDHLLHHDVRSCSS